MKAWQSVLLGFLLALLLAFAIGTVRYGWRESIMRTQAALGSKELQKVVHWIGHTSWSCSVFQDKSGSNEACYTALKNMPEAL